MTWRSESGKVLLLSFCCGKAATEVLSKSGKEAVLICPAMAKPQVQYRAISWYKVSANGLSGILRWDRKRSEVLMYHGFTRPVQCPISNCLSLSLRNLTCEDGGEYRCTLWAPLGHQSREGTVHLNIKGTFTGEIKNAYPCVSMMMTHHRH
uniref:Ig-like domain-containing protein n=1 Tax=Scleropages formosus TaxID=113540 RepID=A0A8C9TXP2_SCLFO